MSIPLEGIILPSWLSSGPVRAEISSLGCGGQADLDASVERVSGLVL